MPPASFAGCKHLESLYLVCRTSEAVHSYTWLDWLAIFLPCTVWMRQYKRKWILVSLLSSALDGFLFCFGKWYACREAVNPQPRLCPCQRSSGFCLEAVFTWWSLAPKTSASHG